MMEVFKQVKINIPLLDAIKQILSYAKFLKNLCTIERKMNVKKKKKQSFFYGRASECYFIAQNIHEI